jgi:2-polyprenyl-3-methyl-5-hydroxy-6-metoxy-1,4-benzoquinol methylase
MLKGRPTEEILDFYTTLVEPNPGYEGYSEPTLKRMVVDTVAALPGSRVIDLGCGPNPLVLFRLATRGKSDLTAVELSADFCEKARAMASAQGVPVDIHCARVDDTGLPERSFDIAILTEVLEHVPDELVQPTLREVHRLLAPGGHFVISVPNANSWGDRWAAWRRGWVDQHPEHLRDYTPTLLQEELTAAGFEIVRPLRVPATDQPPWRAGAAWVIDRLTWNPGRSLKASFLARRSA